MSKYLSQYDIYKIMLSGTVKNNVAKTYMTSLQLRESKVSITEQQDCKQNSNLNDALTLIRNEQIDMHNSQQTLKYSKSADKIEINAITNTDSEILLNKTQESTHSDKKTRQQLKNEKELKISNDACNDVTTSNLSEDCIQPKNDTHSDKQQICYNKTNNLQQQIQMQQCGRWSEQEVQMLRVQIFENRRNGVVNIVDIRHLFPNKSIIQIYYKAGCLKSNFENIKNIRFQMKDNTVWTAKELSLLNEFFKNHNKVDDNINMYLGEIIPEKSIDSKMIKVMQLKDAYRSRDTSHNWTMEEEQKLEQFINNHNYEKIIDMTNYEELFPNKSRIAIRSKATKLMDKLVKIRFTINPNKIYKKYWTKYEIAELEEFMQQYSMDNINYYSILQKILPQHSIREKISKIQNLTKQPGLFCENNDTSVDSKSQNSQWTIEQIEKLLNKLIEMQHNGVVQVRKLYQFFPEKTEAEIRYQILNMWGAHNLQVWKAKFVWL